MLDEIVPKLSYYLFSLESYYDCPFVLTQLFCAGVFCLIYHFMRGKFARFNLFFAAWVALAFVIYLAGFDMCMCGFIFGVHHLVGSAILPVVNSALVFFTPFFYLKIFVFFWIPIVIFTRKMCEGESLKDLWIARVGRLFCFSILVFLGGSLRNCVGVSNCFTGDIPVVVLVACVLVIFSLFFVGRGKRMCFALLSIALTCLAYFVSDSARKNKRFIHEVPVSAPISCYEYSPQKDPKDFYSRNICSMPKMAMSIHHYKDGWSLQEFLDSAGSRYKCIDKKSNPEDFEKLRVRIFKLIDILDDSASLQVFKDFLIGGKNLTLVCVLQGNPFDAYEDDNKLVSKIEILAFDDSTRKICYFKIDVSFLKEGE